MKTSLLAFVCAAALLAGCINVGTSSQGTDLVTVDNSCLQLFYCIPICSGDPEYPNQQVASWWENTVTVKNNVKMLEDAAARQGASGLRNIVSRIDDERIFWPFLQRTTLRTSAELVR